MAAIKQFRLSPWLIALMAVCFLLDASAFILLSLLFVLLHEGGHMAAARRCGLAVEGVEIAPFGGVARICGLEQLGKGQGVWVALAGPLVNLVLCWLFAGLIALLPAAADFFYSCFNINLTLFLLNMLPAWPLDGGRILSILLRDKMGQRRAMRVSCLLGVALGLTMMTLGLLSLQVIGKLNLTLLICGAYIVFTAGREYRNAPMTYISTLAERTHRMRAVHTLPVKCIAVMRGAEPTRVLSQLLPGAIYRIFYLDENLRIVDEKWESELWDEACGRKLP